MFTLEQINQNLVYCPLPVGRGRGARIYYSVPLSVVLSAGRYCVIRFLSKAFYSLIALLTYYPDTIQWIFVKIGGEIEVQSLWNVRALQCPIFSGKSGRQYDSWASLFNNALSVFPMKSCKFAKAWTWRGLMGMVNYLVWQRAERLFWCEKFWCVGV